MINFLRKEKGTQQKEVDLFGLTLNGVQKIWRKYKEYGIRGMTSKKRGVHGGKKINGTQAAEVWRWMKDKWPDQMKLAYCLFFY